VDRVPLITVGGLQPPTVKGAIEFRNVELRYPTRPDIPVLENLNLTIPEGTVTAICGPSGSGKSTIVQLLERFYDPTAGAIILDGNDLKDVDPMWLRDNVGLVGQEPVLFDGTIFENVSRGRRDRVVTTEEVQEALKNANAWDFIQRLPLGVDTIVGERGVLLSGGQKQRIAIARALIKNPKVRCRQ
jgi:ABC-type multidrug transport system fused ATPase/permease subunit